LKDIGVAVLAPWNFGSIGKIPETFLAAGRVTSMYPEDPRVGGLLSNLVAVFSGKLRFPAT
jgi:hypothetical protein